MKLYIDRQTDRQMPYWTMVAHAFNPSNWEAEAGGTLEFEANLTYRGSSRTARIHRETLS